MCYQIRERQPGVGCSPRNALSVSSRQYPTAGRQLIYQNQLLSFLFPIKSFVIWTGRAVKTNRILKGRNWKCRYDISSRLDTQYTGKGQEPSNVDCIIRRGWKDRNWVAASTTNYRHTAASHATRINKRRTPTPHPQKKMDSTWIQLVICYTGENIQLMSSVAWEIYKQ